MGTQILDSVDVYNVKANKAGESRWRNLFAQLEHICDLVEEHSVTDKLATEILAEMRR